MIDISGLTHQDQVRDTIDKVIAAAFTAESASRHRDPHHIGLSALAGCTRAAAHQLAGTESSNDVPPGEGRAANLGTWQHNGLLPRMAHQLAGADCEIEVTLTVAGHRLRGHVDLPAPDLILDLKTVGEHRLQHVRRRGPIPAHVLQVAAYGVAMLQAGHPVRWLVLVYLDRATGDAETMVIPFTNRLALGVIDRVADLSEHAKDPDAAPRSDAEERQLMGPGSSFECNECPWLKRCWGLDAEPGHRQPREYERPDVEALLAAYDEARSEASDAQRRKDELLALLESVRHGQYGTFHYSRNRDTQIDDGAAAIRILQELGVRVPRTWRRGSVNIRLVKPASAKPKRTRGKPAGE